MKYPVVLLTIFLASSAQADTGPSVEVMTASIVQSTLHQTVQAYGTIDTAPDKMAAISLPYAGQIARLAITNGKTVKRNDVLFEFHPDPAVTLSFQQAQTALTLAKGELARTRQLLDQHLATNSQLAMAQKALDDAQAAVKLQQVAGGGQISVTVRAPFDGTITNLASAAGDRIAASLTILDVVSNSDAIASLGLEPAESHLVKPGQSVTLQGLDDETALKGVIDNVGGALEPKSGLIIATLHITTDPSQSILSGEHVRGLIEVAKQSAAAVPRAAVLTDAGEPYIFQVVGGTAKRITIKTGLESDGLVAITGPFDPAQPVIVEGNYETQNGMAVRLKAKPAQAAR